MDACRPGDLAGGLRQAVPRVDRPSEIEDAEEQHQEDGEGDGEFDHRLTAVFRAMSGLHFVVTDT